MTESNKQSIKRGSLKRTLTLWFLLLAVVPMTFISWISYSEMNLSLKQNANSKLFQAARAKTAFLQNWFDYRFMDLRGQAEDSQNANLLLKLRKGYLASGLPSSEYVKSFEWIKQVDGTQNHLVSLSRHYDYIYDLFLIDLEGNILFSVVHESDLGSNLFKGPLSKTRFAASVAKTLQNGEARFSDIERYAPSNNKIAGFLTAPLLNEFGDKIGVFAIQIKLDRVLGRVEKTHDSGKSRVHFLVGDDGLLRTAIAGNYAEVLSRKFDMTHSEVTEKSHDYIGVNGKEVIGFHQKLPLPNVNWILYSEINHDEAMAVADQLGIVILVLVISTGLLVSVLAYFKASQITRPIVNLAKASRAATVGQLDKLVTSSSNDEIGLLTDSFNHMLVKRQQQQESLQQSNFATLKALDDLAEQRMAVDEHSIVAITDIGGDIIFCNDKFCSISGYSRDEILGNNHRILNSGYHDKEFFRDMFKHISSGETWHGDICNRAKNGELYWVDSSIVPTRGKDGKIKSYIAIRTDISELKNTQKSLMESTQIAESANQAKSEFLANMSHEIRTPMNGVLGMTNLLLDSKLETEQRDRVETLKRSGESLLAVINDILDFSKIEAGKLAIELIDFDLGTLIENFAETMAYRAEEKHLELICPVNPIKQRWYHGDPGRLRQILTNLVGNAIKFTSQGEVSVKYEEQATAKGENYLLFTVTDSGIGLNSKQQQGLFERFTQADGSTTREFGGSGLGLSISKKLVEMMGGEIGVNSEFGKGSSFWFSISLSPAKVQPPPQQALEFLQQRILMVDDNPTNLELIEAVLNNWGVENQLARSGEEALQLLSQAVEQNKPYTIALIDKLMPKMDGLQLGDIIHRDRILKATETVLLMPQNQQGDAKQQALAGFSAFLSKPINQSDLYNTLMQIAGVSENEAQFESQSSVEKIEQFDGRILIVEDNLTNQQVAKGMLEKFGLKIDIANHGQESIEALKQDHYDLVFMDCQMPVMDGYQATEAIRMTTSLVKNPQIPIIAMTANVMPMDLDKCTAVGMNGHLSKPVDPVKLLKILKKWLPKTSYKKVNQKYSTTNRSSEYADKDSLSNSLVVFDAEALSKRLMGDKELINTVKQAFLFDMEKQFEDFKKLVSDKDLKKIASQAHKIKGASGNIGGLAFSALALEMETLAKTGKIKPIQQKIVEFENNFIQLKVALGALEK